MNATRLFIHRLLLFGLVITTLAACNPKAEKPAGEGDRSEAPPEMAERPNTIISLESAKSIYDNYSRYRVPNIKKFETEQRAPEKEFEVARFVSFDLEMIKQYIAYVEQESKKAGVTPNTLRFYFANYPNEARFPDGKKVIHPRQNSIFVLPTLQDGKNNWGYYIGADGKAKLIKDWVKANGDGEEDDPKSKAGFLLSLNSSLFQDDKSLVMNHSSSGPPPGGDFE